MFYCPENPALFAGIFVFCFIKIAEMGVGAEGGELNGNPFANFAE